jgi:pimeloyl-ACP methyl ester carboxylesterase
MEQGPSASLRTRRVTTEDGLELEVADSGQGPPILRLHGFPDSSAMWDGCDPASRRRRAPSHRIQPARLRRILCAYRASLLRDRPDRPRCGRGARRA